MKKYPLLLSCLSVLFCAQIKEEDSDSAELAAAELNKVSLYEIGTAAPPSETPLPSPHLRLGENLITNGSFESPVLSARWATYDSEMVPGWQASWLDATCATPPQIELQNKDLFSTAPHENQYTELDADNACTADARVKLMQSFRTEANHIYRVTFWVRARDAEHLMGVRADFGQGYALEIMPPIGAWQIVTVHIEATGDITTLSFTDTGFGDTYGTFIDAVEVREVTVDTENMPKPKGKKGKGKPKQSFENGRRHKDCSRAR